MLKQERMFLYFVSNPNSPYYQSDVFGRVIDYATQNVRRCSIRETASNGAGSVPARGAKRSMVITAVPKVEEAVKILKSILTTD